MTLIKLDSGDYINTEFVEALLKMDDGWNAGMNHGETIRLTLADRDRIVEAMGESHNVKPDFTRLVMAYTKLCDINDEQIRNYTSLDFSPALEYLRNAINGDKQ